MIDWASQLNFSGLEKQYGLPSGILSSMMKAESSGNPLSVSPAGAVGLFQFMPATAKQYGIDPTDPQQSAVGAAKYISDLRDRFGDIPQALAAYNYGPTALARNGMSNVPEETKNYVSKIASEIGDALIPSANAGEFDLSKLTDEELKELAMKEGVGKEDFSTLSDDDIKKLAAEEGISTKQQPKESHVTEDIVKNIALGAQAGLEGLAGALSPVYDVAAAPFNAMGANIKPLEQWLRSSQYYIKPEGEKENIPYDVISGASTALPYILTGQTLASSAKPALAAAGKTLAESPISQMGALSGLTAGLGLGERQKLPPAATGALALGGLVGGIKGGKTLESAIEKAPQVAKTALTKWGEFFGKKPSISSTEGSEVLKELENPQVLRTYTGEKIATNEPMSKYGVVGTENFEIPKRFNSITEAKDAVNKGYSTLESRGVKMTPNGTDSLFDAMESVIPKNEVSKATLSSNPVMKFINERSAVKGNPLSFEGFQQLDKDLTAEISKHIESTGRFTDEARLLKEAQESLRKRMSSMSPEDFVGGTDKGNRKLLDDVRGLYSRTRLTQDLEDLMYKSELSSNPKATMQNGAKLILTTKRGRGLIPEERKLLENVAKTGEFGKFSKILENRLVYLLAKPFGPVADVAAATVIPEISKGIASKAKASQLNRVGTAILNRGTEPVKRKLVSPELKKSATIAAAESGPNNNNR